MTLHAHPAPPEVVASLQEIVHTIKARRRAKQAQALAHYAPVAIETKADSGSASTCRAAWSAA